MVEQAQRGEGRAGRSTLERGPEVLRLGRSGVLEARLTRRPDDISAAQALRYEVFYENGGALARGDAALQRRDLCAFDAICDHLIVFDVSAAAQPIAVGAYRLLRQETAERNDGFYSEREFEIGPLLARHRGKRFLELGRSCVLPDYRAKRVLALLWRSLHLYIGMHNVDVMFGCASLPGVNPSSMAPELAFLHHYAGARPEWRARALPERFVRMDAVEKQAISPRRAISRLPPLLKGYLRLGAQIGEGAVIDSEFGAVDVLVVMPVPELDARYLAHFSAAAEGDRQVA